MSAPTSPGLAALGLSESTVHAFAAALQEVVAAGVGAALPSLSTIAHSGRVAVLSLLYLCFACRVAGYLDLTPI